MSTTENIKRYINNPKIKTNPAVDQHVLNDLLNRMPPADAAAVPATQPSLWRILMKTKRTKFAAVAAVIAVITIVSTQLMFVQPTFADVVRPILNARTLIYDFVTGPEEEGILMHDIVVGSRIRRTISTMPNITMVLDLDNARMLHLDNDKKEALYFDLNGPLQSGTQGFLNFIRTTITRLQENPEFSAEKLGYKTIDGKKAVGFAAGGQDVRIQIWADAKTSLPLRIELGMGPQSTTLKNFRFDVPVDPALVSMDVPAGYALKESAMDLSDATEEDFIAGLKVWAELFLDGRFPESITNDQYMRQVPLLEGAVARLNISEAQAEQMGVHFIKGMMFISLFEVKGHEQWHYAGSGVKLGDAATPIFWYRPKDAQNYRVLYGDLRVEDVPADRLPK
jgi:hypothetical protein